MVLLGGNDGSSSSGKPKKKKPQGSPLNPFGPKVSTPKPTYQPKPGVYNPSYNSPSSSKTPDYLKPRQSPFELPKVHVERPNLTGLLASLKDQTAKKQLTKDAADANRDAINDVIGGTSDSLKSLFGGKLEGQKPKTVPFIDVLKQDIGSSNGQPVEDRSKLNNFLQQIADPTAPQGFMLPVPKKYRGDAWNRETINMELSEASNDVDYQWKMNDLLDRQFSDRETYLLGGEGYDGDTDGTGLLYRRSDKIIKALQAAEDGLYEGDFDVLRKEMEKGLSLDLPTFKSEFGVTPKQVVNEWIKNKDKYGPVGSDERKAAYRRMDMLRKHLTKIKDQYGDSRAAVNRAIAQYEDKYKDRLSKYENWSGAESNKHKEIAAKASKTPIPDLTPKTSDEDQYIMDQAGGDRGLAGLLGGTENTYKDADDKTRKEVLDKFGLKKLPSIRDMLALKVTEGNLDPKNQEEVDKWIERFKNPNHPDTRAMYAAFGTQFGEKKVKDDDMLKFINEPVVKYGENLTKIQEKNAKDLYKITEAEDKSGFDWSDLNDFDDHLRSIGGIGLEGYAAGGGKEPGIAISSKDDLPGVDVDVSNGMMWTMDKLMRPLYGVAGMADKIYSLDEDRDTNWTGQDGFFGTMLGATLDPVSLLTGQSWIDSVDEIASNPGALGDVANEGYQQVFRGSNLPGVRDSIIPTTFSHVIANNAARDADNNLYDKDWYQNVAGFVLDAGLDPLNLIGVGVIDDTVKLSVKAAKAAAEASGASRMVDINRFYSMVSRPDASAIGEHVFRVNQGISRLGEDLAYTSDAGLFGKPTVRINDPVGTLSAEGVLSSKIDFQPFRTSVNEYHVQRVKIANDTGSNHVLETVDNIDGTGSITQRIGDTLRVNRLVATIGNKGWEAASSLKAMARGQGFHRDVARYLDEGGSLPHGMDRAEYNRIAANPDAVGHYQPGPISDSLVSAYASAMKLPVEQFPFSEREIYESLVHGPRMLQRSDDVFRARYQKAKNRVSQSANSYRDARNAAQKANARRGLDMALRDLQTDVYGASLRYLDALGKVKQGQALYRDADMAEKLLFARSIVRPRRDRLIEEDTSHNLDFTPAKGKQMGGDLSKEEQDALKAKLSDSTGKGNQDVYEPGKDRLAEDFGQETSDYSVYNDLQDEDLADLSHPIYINRASYGGLSDEGSHLKQLDRILTQRINRLRLDKDGKLTGLPPREAYEVSRLVPDSLRKADGSIDGTKLSKVFYIQDRDYVRKVLKKDPDQNPHLVTNEVKYTLGKDASPEDYHFAELMRGAMQDEFRDAYILRGEEMYQYNLANEGGAPVGTSKVDALGKKPERSDPIVPSKGFENSAWGKEFPDGFASRQDLMDYALESPENFYAALYQAGAPFKFKSYKRMPFKGKNPEFDEPSKLRQWANKHGNRDEVDSYMREVADANYVHMIEDLSRVETNIDGVASHTTYRDRIRDNSNRSVGNQALAKKFDETWNATVRAREAQWSKSVEEARQLDAKANKQVERRLGEPDPIQKAKIRRKAWEDARQAVVRSVVENQKVPRSTANERLTINETARAAEREVKKDYAYQVNELQGQILQATDAARVKELEAAIGGLTKAKNQILKKIEKARREGHETRKVMNRRLDEELILQMSSLPERADVKALQFRIAGFRKNIQFENSMFSGMKIMEKLLPAHTYQKFADSWVRPTKHLIHKESILFRAMIESKTPVVIKAHLARLSRRMGKITTANRTAMFEAARRGRAYNGAQADLYKGVKAEIDELETIFQGTHQFYRFKDVNGKVTALSLHDINAFLKGDMKMDIDDLLRRARGNESGSITIDDVFESMKARNPKADVNDPFRFAWTVRLAADQARQVRSVQHLMRETFGVKRAGTVSYKNGEQVFTRTKSAKGDVVEKLKDKGWETIPELGLGHYFPPEAVQDMKKLLEFMNPAIDKSGIMKQFDTIMGYWKQGTTIYNPGYYTRNGIGEIMSSWLDGVVNPIHYRRSMKVIRYLKNTDQELADLVERWAVPGIKPNTSSANEVLFSLKGGRKITIEDVLQQYINHGLKSTFANTDIGTGLRGLAGHSLADGSIKKGLRQTNENFHDFGEGFEDWLRMAHFVHAMENSGKTSIEAAAEYAAAKVRKYHFDYTDFSKFEQTTMLRAFPFYKWTRRGAPLMLAHLFLTPGKMAVLPKAMDTLSGLGPDPSQLMPWNWNDDDPLFSTQDVHDDMNGNLPDYRGIAPAWVKDLFAYEMNPTPEDEYANYFRVQTPMIDGLNAVLDVAENPLDPQSWDTARGLLNPAIKMPLELMMNKSLDPESPYQIMGGDYNESNGINPLEAFITYAARNLQPGAGFLAKLSKNGDLGSLSMGYGGYRDEHGYEKSKDIASFLTGLGFYQGMPKDAPIKPDSDNPTPVGQYDKSELPVFPGASRPQDDPSNPSKELEVTDGIIRDILQGNFDSSNGLGSGGYSGSGWRNFGYGGYGYGGGYGGGYGSSGFDLLAFLRQLAQQIDQGQIYKGDLNND